MGLDLTGLGSVADFGKQVVGVVERFLPAKKMTEAERAQAERAVQELTGKRDDKLLETQGKVITAEMQQGDNYTKRARPSVIYVGLGVIVANHVVLPFFAWCIKVIAVFFTIATIPELPEFSLPAAFWATWGGVASVWIVGRSSEKRGLTGKIISMVTGN